MGIAGIEEAVAGQITFVSNKKYAGLAQTTKASALIVDAAFPELVIPTLRVADPQLAYALTIELFYRPPVTAAGIHPTAVISPTANIGARPSIGPYAVIGDDCVLGDDVILHPHTVLYPGVRLGNRVLVHAHAVIREHCVLGDDVILQNGAIIGADGFGFARTKAAAGAPAWYKIVQSGPAVLEDHVEIQANACIDRATLGETRIHLGAKIDNLVQIGHGTSVGQNTLLCSQTGIAGSTTVGKNVILAGQVGVNGHITIGDGVISTGQTGITKDVAPGKHISGNPYVETRDWLKSMALFNRLPELIRELRGELRKSREE